MRSIDCLEAQRLIGAGVQLVETLPSEEFEWAHLPGARQIAVRDLNAESVAVLDRSRTVVVYCNDFL